MDESSGEYRDHVLLEESQMYGRLFKHGDTAQAVQAREIKDAQLELAHVKQVVAQLEDIKTKTKSPLWFELKQLNVLEAGRVARMKLGSGLTNEQILDGLLAEARADVARAEQALNKATSQKSRRA